MQPHRQSFRHSNAAVGAKYEAHHRGLPVASMLKMIAAGMLIDRFSLKSPVERACVYAGLAVAMGWVESLMRQKKEDARAREHSR